MINKIFAQNFVRKIQQSMKLKVNVMDEKGVIIASTSKERVGDFHICAYEIIQKELPMLVTTEPTRELIGVNAPGGEPAPDQQQRDDRRDRGQRGPGEDHGYREDGQAHL